MAKVSLSWWRMTKEPTRSKRFFLPQWKWVKQRLSCGAFQPQPIVYDDLYTQPAPCCLYPISFSLRPIPNQALRALTKSEAYDLLSLIAILRRKCFCGTNADLPTLPVTSKPPLPVFPIPSAFCFCPGTHTVHSHSPLTWSADSDFPLIETVTNNHCVFQHI